MNWLFLEPNPIALNTILAMTGMASPVFRAPYYPYDLEKRLQGVDYLKNFLENEIAGGKPKVMDDGDFKVIGDWARGVCQIKAISNW